MNRFASLLAVLLLVMAAHATTWGPTKKTDPLSGDKITVQEPASCGSYIYNWPSKYDLVFWPFIDEEWICFNPKNGYAAFNPDFEKVSDEDKTKLKKWLDENYKAAEAPKSHKEKLAWLEKVYRQRNMDDGFWCKFYRLMAFMHQENQKKSIEYVKKALPLLSAKLKTNPEGTDRLEVLYLLGEYNRRTGELEKSRQYFGQVKTVKYKDEDGKEKTGHPYFMELVQDREQLSKGASPNKSDAETSK